MAGNWNLEICDVCRLIDGDVSPKWCAYCSLCDAWVCVDDQSRPGRRLHAAYLRRLEVMRNGMLA